MKTLESVFINAIKPFYTYQNLYYFPIKSLDEINSFYDIFEHNKKCCSVICKIDEIHSSIMKIYTLVLPINVDRFEMFVKTIFNSFQEINNPSVFEDKLDLVKNLVDNPIKYNIVLQL